MKKHGQPCYPTPMRIPRMKSPPVTLRSITSPPGFHGHTLDPEVCARWKITAPVQASPRGVPRAIAGKSHCGLNVQRIVDEVCLEIQNTEGRALCERNVHARALVLMPAIRC